MRYQKKSIVVGMLLVIATPELASAASIPLVGGLIDYSERAQIVGEETRLGTDPARAESVHVAYGEVSGSATNTAGTAQTPASTLVSAYGKSGYPDVYSNTDITFDARLIKLHPDAPDDIGIPLLYRNSMSATNNSLAELVIRAGEILVQEQVQGSSRNISSSLNVMSNEYLRVGVAAYAGSSDSVETASASTPVFAIDPDFTVEFLGRTVAAADLYTLAVKPEIGFAGNFRTTTSLTDGCLPDPSILAPSGLPSVADGETVTCQALDPSGFRSYGNDPGIPSGILNDIQIVITEDATVMTDEDGTLVEDGIATIGILGAGNSIHNQGKVQALGENSNAVYAEGDRFDLLNQGDIETQSDDSGVVYIYGDEAGVVNEGNVTSSGILSSAIVVEGDDAFVLNKGTIGTGGDGSSGIVVEGDFATVANNGSVVTTGNFSAGVVLLGDDSVSDIDNTGSIRSSGDDAQGILVIGQNHSLDNQDGTITTSGARAHGMALGLQEVVLPPGVEAPPGIFDPASGTINNSGIITTTGAKADAIHALAHNLQIDNSGQLYTSGVAAHGVSVSGNSTTVENSGHVKTDAINAYGISVAGNDSTIINNTNAEILIEGNGGGGIQISGSNSTVTNQNLINTGGNQSHGIEATGTNATITNDGGNVTTLGKSADAIRVNSQQAQILNTTFGYLQTEGEESAAINVVAAEQATITNYGSIVSGGNSANDNYGIKASFSGAAPAGTRTITNLGLISAEGLVGSRGIDASGDDMFVENGRTGVPGTSITVSSGLGAGISVYGKNAHISNAAPITVEGDVITGIDVTAGIGAGFFVENSSTITLTGNSGTGMSLSGAGLQTGPVPSFSAGGCTRNPFGRDMLNCNTINLVGNHLTGMSIASTADANVENQILIFGSGDNLRGMAASDTTNTLITNFDRIYLDGSDAIGIEVDGDGNTVFSGSGDTKFPDGILIHSFLDFVTDKDDPGSGPRTGDITITGDNASAIVIKGENNRIGIRAYGQVVASGTNAIAVKMSGNNNILVNDGVLVGTSIAIQGSAGSEFILNDGAINGAVNLLAGEDTMMITDWTTQVGVVDGGDGIDTLNVVVPRPGIKDPVSIISRVDGQEYINFESLVKEGQGVMSLVGNLTTWDTQVKEGAINIENGITLETVNATVSGTANTPEGQSWIAIESGGTLITGGDITLNEFGILAISQNATAVATDVIVNDGSILYGKGRVIGHVTARGGQILPGTSTGLLTIEGDLNLENGALVMEADSLLDKDLLVVEGNVMLTGGYIDVILGFTPEPEDIIELMLIDGILNFGEGFGGIRGFAAAGSGVALGTELSILLGDQQLQGFVTSVVPVPPAIMLFFSAMLGLVVIAKRQNG